MLLSLLIFTFSFPQALDFGTDFVGVYERKKLSPKVQAENKSLNKFRSNAEKKKGSAILIQPVYVYIEVNKLKQNIPTALIISQ